MRKIIETLEGESHTASSGLLLDEFLKLPRKCQEMFFSYLEGMGGGSKNPYLPFYVGGLSNEFCESPIELIFIMAFNVLSIDVFEHDLTLLEQEEINVDGKNYRVDFLFDTNENADFYWFENELRLVIECDGHDFHKITKAQVKRDNERDCDLKMAGYDILHFSGSQIYNEPWKCAERVYDYILAKVGKITPHAPTDKKEES